MAEAIFAAVESFNEASANHHEETSWRPPLP